MNTHHVTGVYFRSVQKLQLELTGISRISHKLPRFPHTLPACPKISLAYDQDVSNSCIDHRKGEILFPHRSLIHPSRAMTFLPLASPSSFVRVQEIRGCRVFHPNAFPISAYTGAPILWVVSYIMSL